jgi:hypothetical protein
VKRLAPVDSDEEDGPVMSKKKFAGKARAKVVDSDDDGEPAIS